MTKHQFNAHLKERGFTQGRNGQVRYWNGIGLLSPDSPTPEPEQQTWDNNAETRESPEELSQEDQAEPTTPDPGSEQPTDRAEIDVPQQIEKVPASTYAGTAYSYEDITDLYLQMARQMPPGKKVYWDVAESHFPSQLVERSEAGTRLRAMIESREQCRVKAAVAWIRHYLSTKETP